MLQLGARTASFWLGLLAIVNVIGALRHPGFDENVWWVDLRRLPFGLDHVLLATAGIAMLAWAMMPERRAVRRVAVVVFASFAAAAVVDTVRYYRLWAGGRIDPAQPVPLSLVLAMLLGGIAVLALHPTPSLRRLPAAVTTAIGTLAFVVAAPIAQITFFGTTDYRAPADVAVVFGARVMPDGSPSIALANRVQTGVELYRDGLVRALIMTGGVEPDTGYDETTVMADRAEELGVPATAIIRDPLGSSTEASALSTSAIFEERGFDRVLAVSHYYHLPRIELSYARLGLSVGTVPAHVTHIPQAAANAAREVPALWVYYLRAILT